MAQPRLDDMTSTGVKLWSHPSALEHYKAGRGFSPVTTHVSPEGACNLDCPYCSVTKRDVHVTLDPDTIERYLAQLQLRGLKAVILTGGGEPTAYKHINRILDFIRRSGLKVALITNGTLASRVRDWDVFEWVRVSINVFPGWEDKIRIPKIRGRVGLSYCFWRQEDIWSKIIAKADELEAEYIRVLPDCTLPQEELIDWHIKLDESMPKDPRLVHQPKLHATPRSKVCHQSYFRPYLHESGWVYPCDSVVLNDSPGVFLKKYSLCEAKDIGAYLDREIEHSFDPTQDCHGCVFTKTVDMLEDYVSGRIEAQPAEDVADSDFV